LGDPGVGYGLDAGKPRPDQPLLVVEAIGGTIPVEDSALNHSPSGVVTVLLDVLDLLAREKGVERKDWAVAALWFVPNRRLAMVIRVNKAPCQGPSSPFECP
jgi:hypothetical protein